MVPKVPVKVVAGLVLRVKLPPTPEIIVHVPLPLVGVFAAKVVLVTPHKLIWSAPAFAVVGLLLKVIVTSSVLATHGAFAIVQRNT